MDSIYSKLAAIQAALKAPKTQYNSFGGYHYRRAEDILEAVKPLLSQYGCTLTCTDELVQVGDRYYIQAVATLADFEGKTISCRAFAREEESKKGMDGSQVTGASSSYARKYALNGLLCIDDTADSDTTNIGDGQPGKKPAAPKKAASKPAPAPAEAPAPKPALSTHEAWIKAIAENAVNKAGVRAEDAYREKFKPSDEQWVDIQDEVFHYRLDHGIKANS